jgi:nicotinamide phosphoribosyltransferase
LNREGKVVIRPDSGDPVDIICGNPNGKNDNERKGVIELLWETFGGTINPKGFKEVRPTYWSNIW